MFAQEYRLLAVLLDDERSGCRPLSRAKLFCQFCVPTMRVSGVALSVAGAHTTSTVVGTDSLSKRLEELELTFREGAVTDALSSGLPVLAPDLTDTTNLRWRWFAPAAVEAGARALFVLLLRTGPAPFGTLSLYRSTTGGLSADQFDDARALARAASLILTSSGKTSSEDAWAWPFGAGSAFPAQVHQAVGATMVHLHVDPQDALALLRAHAYRAGRNLGEVADDIMAGRLRLAV